MYVADFQNFFLSMTNVRISNLQRQGTPQARQKKKLPPTAAAGTTSTGRLPNLISRLRASASDHRGKTTVWPEGTQLEEAITDGTNEATEGQW
jgi:hypothetical protein